MDVPKYKKILPNMPKAKLKTQNISVPIQNNHPKLQTHHPKYKKYHLNHQIPIPQKLNVLRNIKSTVHDIK